MRTAPAVVAALAIPLLLGLAWLPRAEPAEWPCFTPEPAGQDAAIAAYRVGLAPAFAVAAVLLLALAVRLSIDRRRLGGLAGRPGEPTLAAVALALVAVGRLALDLDLLADAALGTFFVIPLLVIAAIPWLIWQPPGLKGASAGQVVPWLSFLAVVLVAGILAYTGRQGWCLD